MYEGSKFLGGEMNVLLLLFEDELKLFFLVFVFIIVVFFLNGEDIVVSK